MRIQHNISALNTHRNLAANNASTGKALEKLSSGFKINRAGDDAAGLAISEKMRGQIRGLDMASKNAQDGISLIQTAEGALNETQAILQRMRELAVQAGNDTNTEDDRGQIQKEIDQLTSEINRIGNTTEFNTKKLINGELSGNVRVGVKAGTEVATVKANSGTYTIGNNPVQWSSGKQLDDASGAINVTVAAGTDPAFDFAKLDGSKTNELKITKNASGKMVVDIDATTLSGRVLTIDNETMTESGDNLVFDQNGIKFSFTKEQVANWKAGASATVDLDRGAAAATSGSAVGTFDLNATTTSLGVISGTVASGNVNTKITGFEVSGGIPEGITEVSISYENDKVTVSLKGENDLVSTHTVSGAATVASGFSFNQNGVKFNLNVGSGVTKIAETTIKLKTTTTKETVGASSGTTQDASVKLQIGANEKQAMTVSIGDMRASALGITGTGSGFNTTATVTDGTNAKTVENSLDLSTHESAAKAITTLDAAINKVSTQRAALGAVQNRLEHTINNLGTSSENLTAAESRIRDTDMAASMMEFTKNNILTQAAQSMLAQANQQPQGVLQLLG